MSSIRKVLSLSLTDPDEQYRAIEAACNIVAVLVLVCGSVTVALLGANEVDSILAMLGVFCMTLLFVVMGQLSNLRGLLRQTLGH